MLSEEKFKMFYFWNLKSSKFKGLNLELSRGVGSVRPCRSSWAAARVWAGGMQMPSAAVVRVPCVCVLYHWPR